MYFFLTNIITQNSNQSSLTRSISLGLFDSIILVTTALFAGLFIRFLYIRYSNTFSSKSSYGNTLVMVTVFVAGLIAVVKSSLALSLGLVGALSVIRFRTAVKEPYTLSYILFAVCIGIAIGASQYIFAATISIIGGIISILINFLNTDNTSKFLKNNDIDTITITGVNNETVLKCIDNLSSLTKTFSIKTLRSEVNSNCIATVGVEIDSKNSLKEIIRALSKFDGITEVAFYNSPT